MARQLGDSAGCQNLCPLPRPSFFALHLLLRLCSCVSVSILCLSSFSHPSSFLPSFSFSSCFSISFFLLFVFIRIDLDTFFFLFSNESGRTSILGPPLNRLTNRKRPFPYIYIYIICVRVYYCINAGTDVLEATQTLMSILGFPSISNISS